ncbi:excinuclease ABC subunit UvrC [Peptoniphilus sp. HMSC062D09]|uniref:excinuclease ABC subunit UvrC n=1 Tax=Peptoniphilus sp. HMSC062D09 TaxID=1739305 RepID=UPI0008A40785|nr:excinuclease ABC subunit UvrC [Peptoniphilus sp. HMSC062D09]OFK79080.1 excinuclease ABC subunit C [Peptoniphilus sp. HMSC062D09]
MLDLRERLDQLPDKPGVYIMKNELDEIIYVGKAKSLRKRVRQYFGSYGKSSKKVASMVSKIHDFEYIIVENEVESLVLESNLIKDNLPKYNILLRDDKQYPYIKVKVNERFPRVMKTRRILKDGAKYFGPYPDVFAVNESIESFERLYPLRTCNLNLENVEEKNYRPCLNYYIGKCLGPCIGNVKDQDYNVMVEEVLSFLSSSDNKLIDKLHEKMMDYSRNLDYENAADIRDRIKNLEYLKERQLISDPEARDDKDIIALAKGIDEVLIQIFFFRNGKIIGREHYMIRDYYNDSYEEIFSSFLKQFYIGASYIPKEIIIEEKPMDIKVLEDWLSEKRGNKVTITVPVKGDKKELVRMVKRNALDMIEKYGDKYKKRAESNRLALEEIKDLIGLSRRPRRIEAYDISNISGVESVGSMVVFEDGDAKKSDYRKFRIKSVIGPDDYSSLKEVIERRFRRGVEEKKEDKNSSFSNFPDLIMMDGGKGQVNAAKEILDKLKLNIEICGLVKDDFHRTRGIIYSNEEFNVDLNSRAYKMIYKIQEEAHRFAINYHRNLRSKTMFKSELDDIKLIGPKRKENLLKHFKSIDKIKKASIQELMEVESMNEKSAESLYEHFRRAKNGS